MLASVRGQLMSWTDSQIFTALVSVIALALSVTNFIYSRRVERRREQLQTRSDAAAADLLLDAAFQTLFGPDGFVRYASTAKLEDARMAVARAGQLVSRSSRLSQYNGYLLEAEGNKLKAAACYRVAIQQDPKRARPYLCLARVTTAAEAIAVLQKAIEVDSSVAAEACYLTGIAYEELQKPQNALSFYFQALEHRPRYVDAQIRLAVTLTSVGQRSEAIGILKQAVAANPMSVIAMTRLGGLLANSGKWKDGIAWIERASNVDPKSEYPHMYMASLYADRGDAARAQECLEKATKLNPACRVDGVGQQLATNIDGLYPEVDAP